MTNDSSNDFQAALNVHKQRRYLEAEEMYNEILSKDPSHLETSLMLGILAAQTDRDEVAAALLIDVVERDPDRLDALKWLSGVLSYLNRHEEAEQYALRAHGINPNDYDALLKLSTAYFGQAKYENACETFAKAIRINWNKSDAFHGLATSFLKLGEPYKARDVLREAVRVIPSIENWLKLGEVCLACEAPDEAIRCAQAVLAGNPNDEGALILMARAHRNAQNELLEDKALEQLAAVNPDHPLGHTLIGRRLQSLGNFVDAETHFRRSVELRSSQGVAYYGITAGRRIVESDLHLVEQMEHQVEDGEMTQDERAHLHFALGKALDNLAQYGKAMAHFDAGNKLMRELRMGTRKFDREAATAQVDGIIELFTKEFIDIQSAKMNANVNLRPQPIFIAGIMRSGTTLAEQIISCHREVGGGGEQGFWRPAETECVNYGKGTVYRDVIRTKAKQYVELLAKIAPEYEYVTDKNPANRMVYGLLHLAFPDSRIIHMKRNSADVAISIYTTLIRTGAPFVGDRDDIVFALQEHDRLVDHWREVIPTERLLEVQYENLVQNREIETRRIIEFCDLPWDEACLHPEDNLRTVVTPSFWQVRQPVYSASLNRWKKYEPWLGAFSALT